MTVMKTIANKIAYKLMLDALGYIKSESGLGPLIHFDILV